MIDFKLMKIFIFLGFYEHKNIKLPQFTSISKEANFRVLHCIWKHANPYPQDEVPFGYFQLHILTHCLASQSAKKMTL